MPSTQVQHYLQRAIDFFDCMQLARDDEAYRDSSALLAIHSAVSFCDALRAGLGNRDFSSEDHARAATKLARQMPAGGTADGTGIAHLRYLIASKTSVAYGDRRVEDKTLGLLVLRAERFAAWANATGKHLNLEGWNDVV